MFPWSDPGRLLGAFASPLRTHLRNPGASGTHSPGGGTEEGGGQGAGQGQGPPCGKSLGYALTETGRHHNPVAQPGHLRTALYCFRQLASGEQWQTVTAYERTKVDKKQESAQEEYRIVIWAKIYSSDKEKNLSILIGSIQDECEMASQMFV